ncbi:hypothetical protein AKJ16_DCAP11965 [Drosera capensis]
MDLFLSGSSEEILPSNPAIFKCPFLRNINEPTNFSFTSPMALTLPIRDAKGPIFEDGPNFEMAFKLFHGDDGVVPLSGRAFVHSENSEPEQSVPQFNPLAARAATITLSGFGGPFGFDSFSWMFKNKKGKSHSSKKESSAQVINILVSYGNSGVYYSYEAGFVCSPLAPFIFYENHLVSSHTASFGGNSKHEALSNDWLQKGNCPIAKSYRAVSGVLPLVAKVLTPPAGITYKCPPAIVAARAALSRTAFAKNLRPQSLPTKVLVIGLLGMAANVPLGAWREHTEKFSPAWFVAVHAAVPFTAMLRKSVLMPKTAMAFTIGASILGQVIGSRAERYRLKAVAVKKMVLSETPADESKLLKEAVGVSNGIRQCGEIIKWDPLLLHAAGSPPPASVCC